VYLAKDISEDETPSSSSHGNNNNYHNAHSSHNSNDNNNDNQQQQVLLQQQQQQQQQHVVLKVTSIHSRQQRDIAEKEAKLLSRLSHPSIVRMIDSCYRTYNNNNNNSHHNNNNHDNLMFDHLDNSNGTNHHHHHNGSSNIRHHHLILMEYCESGTALSVCNNLKNSHKRFDLPSLIIAFGQICNAVSYLHAQRPPIVHRDLKPVNFLVKNGAYKVCDFGSAVFGHVDLRTSRARTEAEEVIQKTTTQMFRSPEMVDLYMSKKLTQR
jgi:serine/threonine protein kinase